MYVGYFQSYVTAFVLNVISLGFVAGTLNKFSLLSELRWLSSRVVSVLDSGAVGPGFKSQSRRCRVTVLGKLFTPIVPLFTKQQNWLGCGGNCRPGGK